MSNQPHSTTRLYVGNLSASVDEYSLMQVCSKHGKISKLDFLFHKAGPQKGKPRGYAFVEYATAEEAKRAQAALNDKLVRGRKLMVTAAAEQTQTDPSDVRLAALSGRGRGRGASRGGDSSRPTAISLLKGQGVANASTDRKIAALEAKLAALRQTKPSASPSGEEHGGEQWLEGLIPDGEGMLGAATGEGGDGAEAGPSGEGKGKGRAQEDKRIKVDALKAGLPARPMFEAAPERER